MEDLTLPKTLIKFCESLPFPITILKPDKTIISANAIFLEKYGLEKENVIHRKCHQVFFHSDNPCPELKCPLNIVLSEKKGASKIKKTVLLDGSDFYEDLIYSPLLNDDGEIDYIVTTVKDITQSKLIEADLNKTKEFLERIIESSVNAIVVADMKGVIILMNESARQLFGYADKVDVGTNVVDYLYTEGGARSVMKKLRSPDYGGLGKLHTTEMKIINSSGEEIPVEMTASIIYDDGKEIASMAIFQDLRSKVEERKRLEETRMQLVQSDKLASIGRLAAGVAHEINNPLGGITIYSHLALEDLPKESSSYQNLLKVVNLAERCKKIIKGLLDFSRQREFEIKSVNVNDIIEEIFSLVETQALFQNIEITKALDPNLPPIRGDKSQLQQVFINLTINAAEAMEDRGRLIVKTSVIDDFIEIKFSDNGTGIPPENIEKIFEPFFTTKSEENGTGLGLAVSHGIITEHKGTISVESTLNEGTTFTIKLPISGT